MHTIATLSRFQLSARTSSSSCSCISVLLGFSVALSNAYVVFLSFPSFLRLQVKKNRTKSNSFHRIITFFASVIYSKCQNSHFKNIYFQKERQIFLPPLITFRSSINLYQHHPAFQKQRALSVQETESVPHKFNQLPYLPKHRLFEDLFLGE